MKPGTIQDLCAYLNVKETFATALKKAAGLRVRKFDLDRVKRWWMDNPNFQVSQVYPRSPSDGSMFIPLRGKFYDEFEAGTKTTEYRPYNGRFNERTCRPGRAVVLSRGYGKSRRLRGEIVSFRVEKNPKHLPGWVECYGSVEKKAACIEIKIST